jgi:hypothetical protein
MLDEEPPGTLRGGTLFLRLFFFAEKRMNRGLGQSPIFNKIIFISFVTFCVDLDARLVDFHGMKETSQYN